MSLSASMHIPFGWKNIVKGYKSGGFVGRSGTQNIVEHIKFWNRGDTHLKDLQSGTMIVYQNNRAQI